jgi:trimethylamine--corrinoid protein Co-methyltransferase
LGIPSCAHGHTSSTHLDYQAAAEKILNGLMIALARPSLLGGLGGLANVTLTSYESILLDNEGYGAIFRTLKGVQIDQDHLAFDTIRELTQTGDVLTSEHTLSHLHSDEVWIPQLADRQGLIGGTTGGQISVKKARDQTRKILDTYKIEPLAESIQLEINAILFAHNQSHIVR